MHTRKVLRMLGKGFFCSAIILLVSNAKLNAQPFTKITTGQVATDLRDASGASWIDYDGDGDLDLFTSNRWIANYIYRNEGNGSFPRANAGSLTAMSSFGNSWADYDNDGDLDVMTVGPTSALHLNLGKGNFADVTAGALGLSNANLAGWGCAWADFDNDRHLDLVIVHVAGQLGTPRPNFLFRNRGDGTFARIIDSPVVMGTGPFTVPTWSDFDQDGDQDLFIASGPSNGTVARDYLYRNQLKQTGVAAFERINEAPLGTALTDGQVLNWIDFDNDGDLDLFVPNVFRTAIQTTAHFYRNDLSNDNHWVKLKLLGTSSNRDGLGAKIRAKATIGGNAYWQLREASSQNTFCGQNGPEIHFGLGEATIVDSLKIEWPLGRIDVYAGVQTDKVYEAMEGAALNPITTAVEEEAPAIPLNFVLEQNYPNPFNPSTSIAFDLPVASHVTLKIFDVNGREVAALLQQQMASGKHRVNFSGSDLTSGVYYYRLEAGPLQGATPAFTAKKAMSFVK